MHVDVFFIDGGTAAHVPRARKFGGPGFFEMRRLEHQRLRSRVGWSAAEHRPVMKVWNRSCTTWIACSKGFVTIAKAVVVLIQCGVCRVIGSEPSTHFSEIG